MEKRRSVTITICSYCTGNRTISYTVWFRHIHTTIKYSKLTQLFTSTCEKNAEFSWAPDTILHTLFQQSYLELGEAFFSERACHYLNWYIAVELSKVRLTHLSTVLTNILLCEEELDTHTHTCNR